MTTMKRIVCLLMAFCGWQAQAQVAWQKSYNISDPACFTMLESAFTILQTADGGYLVGGTYTQANEARLACLLKLDANGDSVWRKLYTYSDRLMKLYTDNNGDLRGVFEQSVGGGGTSLFFTKLDASNGDTISSFKAPKPTAFDVYRYTSHIQLPDGSYLLAAQGNGQGGHFLRFTPGAATATWYADSMANRAMTFTDMVLDGQEVIVTGWSNVKGGTAANFLVGKYDITTGTPVWRRVMLYENGGCCDTRGRCIVKNSKGNYVAGGEWREKINNVINITPAFFVVNSNGDSLSITEPHAQGTVQKMMKWNNYILAAGQLEKDDLAPDNSTVHHTDIAVYALDDDAKLLNTSIRFNNNIAIQTASGYITTHWSSGAIISNADNDVLICGQGAHAPSGNGADQNMFIAKLKPNTTGITNTQIVNHATVFPNPVSNRLYIHMQNNQQAKLAVINLFGQKVYEAQVSGNTTINTEAWSAGTYLVQIIDNSGAVQSAKLVKL